MEFLDYSLGNTDARQQQLAQAEMLRKAGEQKLGAAIRGSKQFDVLQAIAPMLNNEQAAKGIDILARNAQGSAPKMGQQGALLESGEYVENPVYTRERDDQRIAKGQDQLTQLLAARERAQESNALRASLAAQSNALRAQLAGDANNTRALIASMRAGKNETPEGAPKGKLLPVGAIKDLSKKQDVVRTMQDVVGAFKPEYAGTPGLADIENTAGKFLPKALGGEKYQNQANWWQNYTEFANQVRHGLFGSALTEGEKKAFNDAMVVPGMEGGMVAARLKQQQAVLARSFNNLRKNHQGYDISAFEEFEVPVAPTPGQPVGSPLTPAEKAELEALRKKRAGK